MFNIYFKEMKKFISLIALVGAIAACTPEQIETAFKLSGAKVIVEVEVYDVISGSAYQGSYTVNSTIGTVSGNTITYQADESQPIAALENCKVSVTGPKLAKEYSSIFAVPSVLAGGVATITVVVPVGEPINGWTVDWACDESKAVVNDPVVKALYNTHYPTHEYTHEGVTSWYYNDTEFLLQGEVDYTLDSFAVGSDMVDNQIRGFEGVVENCYFGLINEYDKDSVPMKFPFTVSAYAMWNITQTITSVTKPYSVFADKGTEHVDLGSFKLEFIESQVVEPHEIAYPGHEGHYHAGHGHDAHGTKPNAGGGISINM